MGLPIGGLVNNSSTPFVPNTVSSTGVNPSNDASVGTDITDVALAGLADATKAFVATQAPAVQIRTASGATFSGPVAAAPTVTGGTIGGISTTTIAIIGVAIVAVIIVIFMMRK
jgi:hypothetical protein